VLADSPPTAIVSNGSIRARIYLPDVGRGFYRSTRFDWSGMIATLEHGEQQFYGPWFDRSESSVRDFTFQGDAIVAGPESAAVGPAEEFREPLGFTPDVGRTFVKVGVGVLRTADDAPYSPFARYELVESGAWQAEAADDSVEFTQVLGEGATGHGYRYRKTVRLVADSPELTVSHELANTGRLSIETTQYTHHFLTFGGQPTGSGLRLVLPFEVRATPTPGPAVMVAGREVAFRRPLVGRECVSSAIAGFGDRLSDHDIRIEQVETGASVRVTGNRPMVRAWLWAIRSVVSFEPFVAVRVAPGETTTWEWRYRYVTGPVPD